MKPAICRLQTLIGVLLLIYAVSLPAQTAVTGAITGYVKDPSGAVLADATVDATNTNTHITGRPPQISSAFIDFPVSCQEPIRSLSQRPASKNSFGTKSRSRPEQPCPLISR